MRFYTLVFETWSEFSFHMKCAKWFSPVCYLSIKEISEWIPQAGIMGLQDFTEYNISYKIQFWPPGQMWPKMFVKSFRTCFANFWEMRRGRAKTSFVEIFKVSSQLWRGNKGKTRWEMINQTSMESWPIFLTLDMWKASFIKCTHICVQIRRNLHTVCVHLSTSFVKSWTGEWM